MSNLFCRLSSNWLSRRFSVALLALLTTGGSGQIYARTACEISPVATYSRALYASRYELAQASLKDIGIERGAELAAFLQQVLIYMRAYEAGDKDTQSTSLDRIDELVNEVTAQLSENSSLQLQLNAGNIMIHAARIQLLSGQILRSAKLAKAGNRILEAVLEIAPQQPDALLGLGLYQYFAANENNAWGWIKSLLSLQGDKARGRELIEQAAEQSLDYGFEAARSLVMDLNWDRPDICRYTRLFEQPQQFDIQTVEHRQRSIAARLFCGQPQRALQRLDNLENRIAVQDLSVDPTQRQWQFEARLQALAMLGELDALTVMLDAEADTRQRSLIEFSLARALDVTMQREQAQALYAKVAQDGRSDVYVRLAENYAQQAYRAPRAYQAGKQPDMRFACDRGFEQGKAGTE